MATVLLDAPPPARLAGVRLQLSASAVPTLVLAAAIVLAASLYSGFRAVDRHLWDNPIHDRNSHYLYSLRLATDLRQGDVPRFVYHLDQARVWPPLHGVVGAAVLLVGGLDYRLAVLPNVAGWVGTVFFGFLVARRMLPRGGTLAGLVAALFIAASPAHRAFATDIMLESLGAFLSLVVLYCYLRAVQGPGDSRAAGRWLGLALTALFLHKYNYWALLVLTLGVTEAAARPRLLGQGLRRAWQRWDTRSWLSSQARHPLTWVLALFLLPIAAVFWHGPQPLTWRGHSVSLYPPHTLIHLAYVVLFLRVLSWWRASGRKWASGLDVRLQEVIRWHVWPAAAWLLLPKHPSYFLWYLSAANADPSHHFAVLEGLRTYSRWLMEDYHRDLGCTLLAGALCLIGLLCGRRLRPGSTAVLVLVLLAGALTVGHPNQKARCLHSWIAAVWITGGVGLASLIYGRFTAPVARVRPWLAVGVVGGLVWLQGPALSSAGYCLDSGPRPDHPSWVDVTDAYLTDIATSRRTVVLAAVPVRALTQWAVLERCGGLDRLEEHWWGFADDEADNRREFAAWLPSTACDTIVFVERLPGRAPWEAGPECDLHAQLLDVLRGQEVFRLVRQRDFPKHFCRVLIWRRDSN